MSTSDAHGEQLKAALEAEVARFARLYPGSAARFGEIIGKRVSHVAGRVNRLHLGERRVPVNERVLMFVDDRDDISDEDLQRFAVQVAAALGRPPCSHSSSRLRLDGSLAGSTAPVAAQPGDRDGARSRSPSVQAPAARARRGTDGSLTGHE